MEAVLARRSNKAKSLKESMSKQKARGDRVADRILVAIINNDKKLIMNLSCLAGSGAVLSFLASSLRRRKILEVNQETHYWKQRCHQCRGFGASRRRLVIE